jgi:F-box-like
MTIAKNDNPEVRRTDSCYILSLPPELLTKILSYILPTGFLRYGFGDGLLDSLKTLGTIRSVCRRIRCVADNLPFWYDKDFEFESLYPGSYYRNRKEAAQYLEGMLADSHLRHCLSRKREWRVHNSYRDKQMFETLMRTIPGFKENAASLNGVIYESGKDDFGHLNLDELLEGYLSLRKLSFNSRATHVHAKNLPATLRELSILHWQRNEHCTCTLNAVKNLEYLRLDYGCSDDLSNVWIPRLDRLLPTNSSTTIRSLALNFDSQPIDYSTLDLFYNVKKLDITVFSSSLFKYLATSALRLEVIFLQVRLLNSFHGFLPAIESPCLASVREFGVDITVRYDDSDQLMDASDIEPTWEPVVAAIAKLPDLEVVYFDAPLQTDWSTYFIRRCHRLQFLCWSIDEYDIPEELDRSIFESALRHIRPAPCVVILDRCDGARSETNDSWWRTRARDWGYG